MAFPHPPGLIPSEVAFLCEMTLVTIEPRQRLERLDLLSGPTPTLSPPQRRTLPLWLALLLRRQNRARIIPPPWLHPDSLTEILELETDHYPDGFTPGPPLPSPPSSSSKPPHHHHHHLPSPPFLPTSTSTPSSSSSLPTSLPYHYHPLSLLLLTHAASDLPSPDLIQRLIRDIREIRMAKMRKGWRTEGVLTGGGEGVRLDGVGGMEIAEVRGFVGGVVDGLRALGRSREEEEGEEREREGGMGREGTGGEEGDEMEL